MPGDVGSGDDGADRLWWHARRRAPRVLRAVPSAIWEFQGRTVRNHQARDHRRRGGRAGNRGKHTAGRPASDLPNRHTRRAARIARPPAAPAPHPHPRADPIEDSARPRQQSPADPPTVDGGYHDLGTAAVYPMHRDAIALRPHAHARRGCHLRHSEFVVEGMSDAESTFRNGTRG